MAVVIFFVIGLIVRAIALGGGIGTSTLGAPGTL